VLPFAPLFNLHRQEQDPQDEMQYSSIRSSTGTEDVDMKDYQPIGNSAKV
jgi:hypothetical protein